MDQYHELFSDSKAMRQRYEAELNALRRQIEEQTVLSDDEDNSPPPGGAPRTSRLPSEGEWQQ